MPSESILAIDQGTTNTKGILVDRSGKPVFKTTSPLSLQVSAEGFVEQDPELIWLSVLEVIGAALRYSRDSSCEVSAVAISNQRETAVAWDAETGRAIGPAISWQCVRSAAICERAAGHAEAFRIETGLPLAPIVSASKWAWMLENDPAIQELARAGRLRFGTVDSWLIHRMTDGARHVTDMTNASRTGLLSLSNTEWDDNLISLFGIPREALPKVLPSAGNFGSCSAIPNLEGVPIASAIGDSHAAMFGHAQFSAGTIKATYGTGSSLMALAPSLPADTRQLARTIAWSIDGTIQFALEGNIAMSGATIQWLGEFLRTESPTSDVASLAAEAADSAGVYLVPAMAGLGAPYWDAAARGAISGLSRGHNVAHLARAALESIGFQVADVFFAMEDLLGIRFPYLNADGGATRNATLMQFQADIVDRPLVRSSNEELSALGAAWLAGLALGWWRSLTEMEALASPEDRFAPCMQSSKREVLYSGWQRAVRSVLSTTGAGA